MSEITVEPGTDCTVTLHGGMTVAGRLIDVNPVHVRVRQSNGVATVNTPDVKTITAGLPGTCAGCGE